jgi:hypothetical protein
VTTEVLNGGVPALTSESATPEAAQTNAATADPSTGAPEGGSPESQEQKTFTQKELDEILQKRIAKAEARAERRVLRTLERVIPQQQPAVHQPQGQSDDGKPSRTLYASDEAYIDALTDWKLERRDAKASAERQHEQNRSLAQKTESIYADAEKLPGFDREAFDELPLTRSMVEALIDSDNAARLMHHMSANPDDVDRIAKLSPARQAAELGKLEATLASKPPLKTSKTPDPIGDPTARGNTTVVPNDPAKMTHEQYRAWRQKQGARWAN